MIFIDSNIFIRFLTQDNLEMYTKTRSFFMNLDKSNVEYLVEDSVIGEILYVTTSKKLYNLSRKDIVIRLIGILNSKNIYHNYKDPLINALDKFANSNLDFVDCLALNYQDAGIVESIFSFDKKVK